MCLLRARIYSILLSNQWALHMMVNLLCNFQILTSSMHTSLAQFSRRSEGSRTAYTARSRVMIRFILWVSYCKSWNCVCMMRNPSSAPATTIHYSGGYAPLFSYLISLCAIVCWTTLAAQTPFWEGGALANFLAQRNSHGRSLFSFAWTHFSNLHESILVQLVPTQPCALRIKVESPPSKLMNFTFCHTSIAALFHIRCSYCKLRPYGPSAWR